MENSNEYLILKKYFHLQNIEDVNEYLMAKPRTKSCTISCEVEFVTEPGNISPPGHLCPLPLLGGVTLHILLYIMNIFSSSASQGCNKVGCYVVT